MIEPTPTVHNTGVLFSYRNTSPLTLFFILSTPHKSAYCLHFHHKNGIGTELIFINHEQDYTPDRLIWAKTLGPDRMCFYDLSTSTDMSATHTGLHSPPYGRHRTPLPFSGQYFAWRYSLAVFHLFERKSYKSHTSFLFLTFEFGMKWVGA